MNILHQKSSWVSCSRYKKPNPNVKVIFYNKLQEEETSNRIITFKQEI